MSDEDIKQRQENLIALSPEIKDITFALEQYLKVTYFRYVKSYPNGDKYIVCNNGEWLKEYFNAKFYNVELANYYKHPDGSKGISIHSQCSQNHEVCKFWNSLEEVGKYKNIMAFYIKFNNYLELYDFGIDGDPHDSNNIFLNNQPIFQHFFLYFKSRGQTILKTAKENMFQVDIIENYDPNQNWMLGINEQLQKVVRTEMPLLELFLDDEFDDISLSLVEAQSLKFFLDGYKFSQAPQLIGISESRHIDHLGKVMSKLDVKNYTDLRSLCHQKNIARKISFLHLETKKK